MEQHTKILLVVNRAYKRLYKVWFEERSHGANAGGKVRKEGRKALPEWVLLPVELHPLFKSLPVFLSQ